MKQIRLVEPEKLIREEVEMPDIGHGQVLVKVKRIGICGSDIHAYYGNHPYISCPIVQGHEFSGEIARVGKDVKGLYKGDRVTAMPQLVCGKCYPCTHGNYHICNHLKVIGCQADGAAREYIPLDHRLIAKLPDGLSFDQGAMVEPLAVGVHAVKRLGKISGSDLLILGAGPIGNLTAQAAMGFGARAVVITDIIDRRLELAKTCGIERTVNVFKEDLDAKVKEYLGRDGADAILECVGIAETISYAIDTARKGTDIVVVGVFGEKPCMDIGLVQDKELRLIGTLMYKAEDYRDAVEMINDGRIILEPLISRHFLFEEFPDAFAYIEKNREQTMKVMIDV